VFENGTFDIHCTPRPYVLATTGYFTKPATEEARNYFWKVGLRDFDDIIAGIMKLKIPER
jgi:hypothetical protein